MGSSNYFSPWHLKHVYLRPLNVFEQENTLFFTDKLHETLSTRCRIYLPIDAFSCWSLKAE